MAGASEMKTSCVSVGVLRNAPELVFDGALRTMIGLLRAPYFQDFPKCGERMPAAWITVLRCAASLNWPSIVVRQWILRDTINVMLRRHDVKHAYRSRGASV
jgi:hypothetical protein